MKKNLRVFVLVPKFNPKTGKLEGTRRAQLRRLQQPTRRYLTRANFKTKKEQRRAAKLYVTADGNHWKRRIAREMIQNPGVQNWIMHVGKI